MATLYLFAIGGTGSRVLKSLTMLFAAGCKLPNNFDTVVPIVLDPDLQNGDMNRTKDLVEYYQNVQNNIQTPDNFFKQKIESLSYKNGDGLNEKILYSINTQEQQFGDFINYHSQTKENKYFLDLLFSQENRNADLSVGFKGNPNMGSVVLNKFILSDDFKNFENVFGPNDAIFIVSSIFGGTGAAGFPLVLKRLRSSNNSDVRNAMIGALSLQPYFNVLLNEKSAIDSSTFNEKAKAALGYYKRTITENSNILDSFYIIGYDNPKSIPNSDGADMQKNDANFIELACARSIFDFCEDTAKGKPSKCKVKEFGVEDDSLPFTFSSLSKKDYDLLVGPMSKFKLMSNYLQDSTKEPAWKKSFDDNFFNGKEMQDLERIFELYDEWNDEMGKSEPQFIPFIETTSGKEMNFINGKVIKSSFFMGPSTSYKELDKQLNDCIDKHQDSDNLSKFIKMFDHATFVTLNKIKLI